MCDETDCVVRLYMHTVHTQQSMALQPSHREPKYNKRCRARRTYITFYVWPQSIVWTANIRAVLGSHRMNTRNGSTAVCCLLHAYRLSLNRGSLSLYSIPFSLFLSIRHCLPLLLCVLYKYIFFLSTADQLCVNRTVYFPFFHSGFAFRMLSLRNKYDDKTFHQATNRPSERPNSLCFIQYLFVVATVRWTNVYIKLDRMCLQINRMKWRGARSLAYTAYCMPWHRI